jgi:hypothetical protein
MSKNELKSNLLIFAHAQWSKIDNSFKEHNISLKMSQTGSGYDK